jgi:hypothetical protein
MFPSPEFIAAFTSSSNVVCLIEMGVVIACVIIACVLTIADAMADRKAQRNEDSTTHLFNSITHTRSKQ